MSTFVFAFCLFVVVVIIAIISIACSAPETREDPDQKAARLRADGRVLEEEARYNASLQKAEMARAELEDTRLFLKTRNAPTKRVGHA
jgi:hypothetical protein